MYGLIYCATNIINEKKYIGQTKHSLKTRIKSHKHAAFGEVDKTYFHKAIKKYGMDNFMWSILCNVDNKKALEKAEIYWIEYYDTINIGYNLKKGSAHGEYSREARAKMSQSKKGKSLSEATKRKLSIANKGKILSEEHKIKIGMANKGRKRTIESIEKSRKACLGRRAWNKGQKTNIEPWNKGKTGVYTEEMIFNMSIARRGQKPWNKGIKTGIITWPKGKRHTIESKEKNRQAHLGKEPWNKGKKLGPQPEEVIKKRSESNRGKKRSLEIRQKMSRAQKGRIITIEHREKISETLKGSIPSKETKLKLSIAAKKQWANPETKAKMAKAIKNGKRWRN